MGKISWGIAGAGRIAASFAKALAADGDSLRHAVASRNPERGRNFAREWGFGKVCASYGELFADPEIDAVYIATPHMNHAELSIAAMRAGKSVLCEKPAAVNARDLTGIHDCARETGCFFMEALWTKFNPVFQKAMDWIRTGRIGALQAVYADFCISRTPDAVYPDAGYAMNRLYDKALAGGALLDVGIYPVTAAMSAVEASLSGAEDESALFPSCVSVASRTAETGVDAFDSISLRFGRAVAHLSCAIDTECGDLLKSARYVGTEGTVTVPLFWMPQKAELRSGDGNIVEVFERPFGVNGYEYEAAEFCRCMAGRAAGNNIIESPAHTHAQSLRVMRVLDALRRQIGLVYPFEDGLAPATEGTPASAAGDVGRSDGIVVYTDGGCTGNPGPGGWGCVVLADGAQHTASGGEAATTNNRMELSAAIAALSAVAQNESWRPRPVTVCIDSQYVMNGITSWIEGWKRNGWRNAERQPVKNRDLWETLDSLNARLNVTWKWVKGHSGVQYNEICDRLAASEAAKFGR